MHPSSFYDLRARYVYTPLHGPYSLSEALDGLISYSLKESQDFISIGIKRTLRHELISELSNVVDDLQDYLIYFSSRFLISSFKSPDLIKDLWASCHGPKYLTVCWGAVITRLVFAREIIEHNFWPRLFQPAINDLTTLQRLGRPPSLVSPNVSLDKLSTSAFPSASAFTFTSLSHCDNTPRSPRCPLASRRSALNVQSERSRTTPSKTNPTSDVEEGQPSSLALNTMPTPFGSPTTRIPSNCQPSDTSLESCLLQVYEDRPDDVFAPPNQAFVLPNHTSATHCLRSSTSIHTSDARESRNLENNERVAKIDEKGAEEKEAVVGGAGFTDSTSPSSTVLRPMSPTRAPGKTLPPSTALWSTSTTLNIPSSTRNLHFGSTLPLPRSIPLPHSFANAIPWRSARFPPNKQHSQFPLSPIQRPVSSAPLHSLPTTRKRSPKAPTRRSAPSHVNFLISSPVSLPSFDVEPTSRTSGPFQPCPDDQWSSKEPSSTAVDILGDTSSSGLDIPSISPPTPTNNLIPFPATPTSSSSILWGPSQTETSSLTYGNRPMSTKLDVLSHSDKDMTTCSCASVSLHVDDSKGRRSLEFEDRVAQVIRRVTGEGVTEGDTTKKLRTPYPSSTLWPLPTALPTLSPPKRCYFPPSPPFHQRENFRRLQPNFSRSCFPQKHQKRPDKVSVSSNDSITPRYFRGSAPAHVNDARDLKDLKDNMKAGGTNEQATGERKVRGGAGVTEPCTRSLRVQLTSTTHGELVTTPASTSSSTMALWPTSTTPCTPSTANLHQGPTETLPCSISHPRSFSNVNSWFLTRPFSKGQHSQQINNIGYDKHGYSSPDDDNNTLNASHHQPPSSIIFDDASDTSLSSCDDPSVPVFSPSAQSYNLNQHTTSLHPCTPTPSFPRRRCFSLPPTLHQTKSCCGQQLLGLELSIPVIGNGSHLPLSTNPLTLPWSPFRTGLCSEPGQQQLDVQNEHSRTLTAHAVPTVESQDCSPTLDSHALSPPSRTCQPSLNMRDEYKVSSSLDIHMVDDERCSTTTSPLILSIWCPDPTPQIVEDRLDKLFVPLGHSSADYCLTSTHSSNAGQGLLAQGQPGNLKSNKKGMGLNEQVVREMESAVKGQEVTEGSELVMIPARTLSSSTALQPMSMPPLNSNPTLSSTTPTLSLPTMVDNTSDLLLMYKGHSISLSAPSHNHYKYLGSLHARPPTPFFLKQSHSSLLPPFHQPILNHDSADFDSTDFDFDFEPNLAFFF